MLAMQVLDVSSSIVGLHDDEYGATNPIISENRCVPNNGRFAIKLKMFTYEVKCFVPLVNAVKNMTGMAIVIAISVFIVDMVMNTGHVIRLLIASIFTYFVGEAGL